MRALVRLTRGFADCKYKVVRRGPVQIQGISHVKSIFLQHPICSRAMGQDSNTIGPAYGANRFLSAFVLSSFAGINVGFSLNQLLYIPFSYFITFWRKKYYIV